jgi:hypothetical protein
MIFFCKNNGFCLLKFCFAFLFAPLFLKKNYCKCSQLIIELIFLVKTSKKLHPAAFLLAASSKKGVRGSSDGTVESRNGETGVWEY